MPREHRKPELGPPGAPTPADLLGVAHGLQDRMVQGLQGSQDVLIVPHVVHKVIWGRREQRSGVTGFCAFHRSLPPPPIPAPQFPSLHTSWSLALPNPVPTTQLLGVHVAAERTEKGGLRSRPDRPHPPALPPQRARPTELVEGLVPSLFLSCSGIASPTSQVRVQQVNGTSPSEGSSRALSAPQSI